jgi:MFS family permease
MRLQRSNTKTTDFNRYMKRNINTDYLYCFLKNFDISSSIWVLYLIYKGLSLWQIGLVEGVYHLTSFLFELPTGAFADLLGRKRSILIGRICSALSSILCLFGFQIWHFAVAFAISAVGQNMNSGSEEALIYDSMKQLGQEDRYIKVNSRLNVIIEIAQGFATVIGGIISEYSFSWCYITSVIVALLALMPAFLFTEPKLTADTVHSNAFSQIKEHFIISYQLIRQEAKLRNILIYYPLLFTFHTVVFFYGQEFFSSLGLNKIEISMIMLLAGLISILGAMSSERLLVRFGSRTKYLAAYAMGFGIIIMSQHSLILSILAFALVNYANSIQYPIQSVEVNKLIPSGQRATIISVTSMIFSILMFIIFPICGYLADSSNLHLVFLVLGVLLIAVQAFISWLGLRKAV